MPRFLAFPFRRAHDATTAGKLEVESTADTDPRVSGMVDDLLNSPVVLSIDQSRSVTCPPVTQHRTISKHNPSRYAAVAAPSLELVRKQVSKILHSSGFAHAERMRRFLAFIVEETLAGRAGQLCEYSIGISVFDRHESFDPSADPIVRNDARRLRLKLLEYYRQSTVDLDQVVITVPKGSYVPVFTSLSAAKYGTERGYRLSIRLIRASDGVEVFVREYGFYDCPLQFEVVSAGAS